MQLLFSALVISVTGFGLLDQIFSWWVTNSVHEIMSNGAGRIGE